MFTKSKYLWVKDGYFRMFVRWLYQATLDEPYIPNGVVVDILKHPTIFKDKVGKIDKIKLSWPQRFPRRRGNLEEYIKVEDNGQNT